MSITVTITITIVAWRHLEMYTLAAILLRTLCYGRNCYFWCWM